MSDEVEGAAMQVDTDLVRQLANLLDEGDLSEIEVQDGARRIVVKRKLGQPAAPVHYAPAQATAPAPAATSTLEAPAADHAGAVRSPMVGTAYLSGEPGADPFVSEGQSVEAGDTILIVEAMKVMNPILATRTGIVRQILVQNGQPVEFDQPLIIVD